MSVGDEYENLEIIVDSVNRGRKMGVAEAFTKFMAFSRDNEGKHDDVIEKVMNAFFKNEAASEGKNLTEWLDMHSEAIEDMVEWDNAIAGIMNYEEE